MKASTPRSRLPTSLTGRLAIAVVVLILSVMHVRWTLGLLDALPILAPSLAELAEAEVVEKWTRSGRTTGRNSRSTMSYRLRFRYEVDGASVEDDDQLEEQHWDAVAEGDTVQVAYLRAAPSFATVLGNEAHATWFLWATFGGLVLIDTLVVFLWRTFGLARRTTEA